MKCWMGGKVDQAQDQAHRKQEALVVLRVAFGGKFDFEFSNIC